MPLPPRMRLSPHRSGATLSTRVLPRSQVHEVHKDCVTATIRSDYAAQIKTIRTFSATCARAETHNLCVTVVGREPYEVEVHTKKHGKRPASTRMVRKQKVSVFYGFHPSAVKPSARTFNVLREDITMLMKTGTAKHGEWFHDGKRLPGRAGLPCLTASSRNEPNSNVPSDEDGDRFPPLTEAQSSEPLFAALAREVDITDGCAAQFDGKDNYHQVAVWFSKFGVRRLHAILITMHGKNVCDALSNLIQAALRGAVSNGDLVDGGTRELVLWLAQHKPHPSVSKLKKDGWWAIDDIFYGYFDPARFTKVVVPDAKGFVGSADKHRFVGLCADAGKAQRDGPVEVSTSFCGCARCTVFDFSACLMRGVGGMSTQLKRQVVPRVSTSGAPSQSKTLAEFASELRPKQLRALRVDSTEHHLEGGWWLCEIQGCAVQATEQMACATDLFESGWWVVEIKWYQRVTDESPGASSSAPIFKYTLDPNSKRWVTVNALIRGGGLSFEGGVRCPRSGQRTLNRHMVDLINASL